MPGVPIKDKTVLISGSNRGIGKSFAIQAVEMGAKKVYAAARDKSKLAELVEKYGDKIVPLTLDITIQDQVTAAAAAAGDVEVLINNSGMGGGGPMVGNPNPEGQRMEMEVNYFGMIKMCDTFAPILSANGGGAIVNILSVAALSSFAFAPGYSASKAAGRSLTQALRVELRKQGTLVSGVFPGPVDTDMAKNVPMDKVSPDSVAVHVYEEIAKGSEDIFPDPFAEHFAASVQADFKAAEKANAAAF